jgi:hypothetical protein
MMNTLPTLMTPFSDKIEKVVNTGKIDNTDTTVTIGKLDNHFQNSGKIVTIVTTGHPYTGWPVVTIIGTYPR